MGRYIGLDLGTTTIIGLILDTDARQVVHAESARNDTRIAIRHRRSLGRSEWHMVLMHQIVLELLRNLVHASGISQVDAIGVTGQMHGMVLLDGSNTPRSSFIGWQDQRCQEPMPGGTTYIDEMLRRGGELFERSGCTPATGYMGSTLFWMRHNGKIPSGTLACFAPDFVVSSLTDSRPVTDATNAAGSGLLDVANGCWNAELLEALGLDPAWLPEIRPSLDLAGTLSAAAADATALPAGLPVAVASGDNQASFAGAVADYARSLLVNVGTGGQVSVHVDEPVRGDGLDLRPFLRRGYLLVGASLCGGGSFRVLSDFIRAVGAEVFDLHDFDDLDDRLTVLARSAPPGSEGLVCEPVFTGSRQDPLRRARWEGLSDTNFTPANLTRSLLEGLAAQFGLFYDDMRRLGVEARTTLVGAGNGIRRNPVLAEILSSHFGATMRIASHTEEAAVGAALGAAVTAGEFSDIEEAGRRFIRYDGISGGT